MAERPGRAGPELGVVGQPPHAGGNVGGVEAAAKAEPDGHAADEHDRHRQHQPVPLSAPALRSGRRTASIALINQVTNAIRGAPSVRANTFQELLALARQEPGKLNYATPGNGTSGHMSASI